MIKFLIVKINKTSINLLNDSKKVIYLLIFKYLEIIQLSYKALLDFLEKAKNITTQYNQLILKNKL